MLVVLVLNFRQWNNCPTISMKVKNFHRTNMNRKFLFPHFPSFPLFSLFF